MGLGMDLGVGLGGGGGTGRWLGEWMRRRVGVRGVDGADKSEEYGDVFELFVKRVLEF